MTDFSVDVIINPATAAPGIRAVEAQLNRLAATGARTGALITQAYNKGDLSKTLVSLSDFSKGLDETGRSASRTGKLINQAFGGLAAYFGGKKLLGIADTFTQAENSINQVVDSSEQLTAVMDELFNISQRTRSSFEANAQVYRRFALATKDLGLSQRETLQFTESIGQAIAISGASTREAQAALIQLSQGLSSGALRGDELRSVLEQLPEVARVIAKGLGVTVGELRKMGEAGKIVPLQIINAFKAARVELEGKFLKTIPTLSQAFVKLGNQVLISVGEFNKATGITATLAQGIGFLTDNLGALLSIVTILAVGFGAGLIAQIVALQLVTGGLTIAVGGLTGVIGTLTAFIYANPILIGVGLFAGAIASIYLFRDELVNLLRDVDLFGTNLVRTFKLSVDIVSGFWVGLGTAIRGELDKIDIAVFKLTESINKSFGKQVFDNSDFLNRKDIFQIIERSGRSWGENFNKGFEDVTQDGLFTNELMRGIVDPNKAGGLDKQGLDITPTAVSKEAEEALKRQKKLLESIKGAQINFNQNVSDLNLLLSQGKINQEEYTTAMRGFRLEILDTDRSLSGGLQRGLLTIEEKFGDLAGVAEDTLVNAFQTAEDALVKFVTTGKFEFKEMVSSIVSDIARLYIRQQVTAPIAKGLGSIFGGGSSAGSLFSSVLGTSNAGSSRGLFSLFSSALGGAYGPGFATGGSFTVGGSGGTDSQPVNFRATPGEEVTIRTPQQQREGNGGMMLNLNIDASNSQIGVEERIRSVIREIRPQLIREATASVREQSLRNPSYLRR